MTLPASPTGPISTIARHIDVLRRLGAHDEIARVANNEAARLRALAAQYRHNPGQLALQAKHELRRQANEILAYAKRAIR